ncbi:Bacteriohemerythrin [Candidatus Magnetaquicoccaceae bacterium FCR-1]|uniref:Bacteriohemerythrin n=1 Tax=Candidatus Magnetaquiglobus chichijimensis TaxID=3141448 RepID=A0ABQ0C4F6_9PROT
MEIIKIAVAKGIHWVEIPGAGLRILCGCPMDSVKHLMKRGLIISTEKKGVPCETGPNAILLSDNMLQNGELANLGEFPVLQMLYKQGLIIPNHPNNTGLKPLLIGLAEQVNAQLQYIYRGNYGLVSKEEIEATGVDPATAHEMMRLKLRFAFGAIRSTDALLDTCVVGDGEVEIREGVIIRRQARNVYEFAYAGERVTVDLNLAPGERYESAYPLGFQALPREYFAVVHSGEGDGWDVNRPSMSSILMFHGKIYLIDAGPNLFANLLALGIGIDEIEGIFHTHAHDDHFCGITTLMRSGRKIHYYATPLVRASVEKKLAALLSIEEERFGEFFEIHDLEPETWNDIEGLEVRPINSPHPLETTIFIFRSLWQDGYRSYAHFADIVALEVLERMITDDPSRPGIDRAYFERIRAEYLTPATLKKLDIGGGMIHGVAKDFKHDPSERILLAHLARELTPEEREIGSNAPHGMMDVLIAGQSDFARRSAFAFLQSALPDIPIHQLRILLNNPIVHFKPGMILLKEGESPKSLYLILTGAVEKIRTSQNYLGRLYSGTMIGEVPALEEKAARYTYSTACFAQALEIPVFLYLELVRRNDFTAHIARNAEMRAFLQASALFAEGVPDPVLSRVAEGLQARRLPAGYAIPCQEMTALNLIVSGRVERSLGGEQVEILEARDHFGEEMAVFGLPCLFRFRTLEETALFAIPAARLRDIPIVRWKLFEGYHERAARMVHASNDKTLFHWNAAFEIQILEMDIHHKRLFEIANAIIGLLRAGEARQSLEQALDSLVKYTEYHFVAEERLMDRYDYPELERHKAYHRHLEQQVMEYRAHILEHEDPRGIDFNGFFTGWMIRHILSADRQYSAFLNARGIY